MINANKMRVDQIREKIRNKIWELIMDRFYSERVRYAPLVQNLNFNSNPGQRKALICYLPNWYFQTINLKLIGRTIPFEIFKLVRILSDLGFCIDIISANDLRAVDYVRFNSYDLIFGFGETFYRIVQLQPNAVSVLYMTESHPDFSYKEEKKRMDYFYERHRKGIPFERSGRFYKKEHLERKYDHLIALGEAEPFKIQYERPYLIFPTGILNTAFKSKPKDHAKTRKHFVWLGSSAVIHKGLDLLIDVFRVRDDLTLHVCGLNKISRKKINIPPSPNIIDYGHISINSDTFIHIVDSCSFSILPSCSEGMATSITTSMLHGLVPVVIKNTGFNRLGEHAIFLDDFKVEYLHEKITELSEYQPEDLEALSEKVLNFASRNFTPEAYEERLRSILLEIIKESRR